MIIRYVHYMQHPNYRDVLGVGCVCAGKMEGDYAAAERREKALKSVVRQRRSWVSRGWRTSAKGSDYRNTDEFNVSVYRRGRIWNYRIMDRQTERTEFSQRN